MRDFFATAACDWRRPDGSLHVYLIPDDDYRDELARVQEQLPWPRLHARQPPEFLHATVLRSPWYEPELDPGERDSIRQRIARELTNLPAFSLEFDTLQLTDHGVVLAASPTPGWDRLIAALHQGLAGIDVRTPGDSPGFTRPFGPHVSLSYGREHAEDDEIAEVVSQLRVRQEWNVQRVELVAVDMDRQRGTYSWVPVSVHRLNGDQ